MKSGILVPAMLAGLAFSVSGSAAQTSGSTEPARRNPNVPAITGDRQQVPMSGSDRAATPNPRSGSELGLTMEQRPRLREYALKHRESELKIRDDIGVGTVLPESATLLDIPPEFGIGQYRLALANQRTLVVEPSTRRVVEVIQ